MALSTTEHALVKERTREARSTAAAVRRAANRQRVSGAVVLTATDTAGNTYTLVLIPTKDPARAYVLARDKKTQAWRCARFHARWQQTCEHLEAIEAAG